MKQIKEIIEMLIEMNEKLSEFISERYFNSQPIIQMKVDHENTIDFTISDIMLTAAITQSNILLWGSSGSGKTFLAESIAEFLFGKDHYCRKNITPDMNEQDFMDIDFGAIKEGKKLKEAMLADDLFQHPCLIIDEANRAPPIIQNRLMQILENNIDLKSKKIKAGVEYMPGSFYYWNILTLNFGDEYAGTSAVDRALRDRITIDVQIDNFPPTIDDQIMMIRRSPNFADNKYAGTFSQLIYESFKILDSINLSLEAESLILYLSFCSNCVKSQTGSKYGIIFSPEFCKDSDCQYARNPPLNRICPFTFAPSNRVLRKLVQVAKGFLLIKHVKIANLKKAKEGESVMKEYIKNLKDLDVGLEDVVAIGPFVLHSKISMYSEWVNSNYNGNTFFACKDFLKVVYERLDTFIKNLLKVVVTEMRGGTLSEKDKNIKLKMLKEDFHYDGLVKYVMKYLE